MALQLGKGNCILRNGAIWGQRQRDTGISVGDKRGMIKDKR